MIGKEDSGSRKHLGVVADVKTQTVAGSNEIIVGWLDKKLRDGRRLVDEIIVRPEKPTYIHLECMHDKSYWMVIEVGKERKVFWFNSNSPIRLTHEPEE